MSLMSDEAFEAAHVALGEDQRDDEAARCSDRG